MASYYLKKTKSSGWTLYRQSYESGKRKQQHIADLAYLDLGLTPDMPYIKAAQHVKRLNKDGAKFRVSERITNAAQRTEDFVSLNEDLFPTDLIKTFMDKLSEENFGSPEHLKKLYSHFNFIQTMSIELKLDVLLYKENSRKIYKYFIAKKISVNYSTRIISMLNRWGFFVSRQRNKFFEEVPIPRGREKSAIADAQRTKKGTDTQLGVRMESLPLTPEILKRARPSLPPKQANWLMISLWFGLRPEEVDMLKDETRYKIEEDSTLKHPILHVYQSKLQSVSKDRRWKKIPIIFSEQFQCLDLVSSGDFERPLHKTVRKYCGKGVTLYGGRKNFVALMMSENQKIEDITLWLGHKSIETTWLHYKDRTAVNFVQTDRTTKSRLKAVK